MYELDELIEEFEWLASCEKELASSAFAKDSFEDAEKHDLKRTKYIKVAELLKELKERRASEPFINKPCISDGVCREDKMQVLDKIRDEIEQLPTKTITNWNGCCPDIDYPEIEYVDKNILLSIIDKYKVESEED